MGRVHLFEFNDQSWLPGVLRDAMTGYLETVSRLAGFDRKLAPIIERALDETGEDRIVDLCSGGGGPILEIQSRLSRLVPVVLTDKFPNRAVFDAVASDKVTAVHESVDITAVPEHLTGLRTVINAFHHFRPDTARRILADAVTRRAPIVVLEISERTIQNVLLSPLIIPTVLAMMPFVRPLRWQYLLFSYLIPILPLLMFWDGLVSHLRAYSRVELGKVTAAFDGYRWRIERPRVAAGLYATVLVGTPMPEGTP